MYGESGMKNIKAIEVMVDFLVNSYQVSLITLNLYLKFYIVSTQPTDSTCM